MAGKTKGLLHEGIDIPITVDSLSLKIKWMQDAKIPLEFKVSCLKQDKTTFTPKNVVNLSFVYE